MAEPSRTPPFLLEHLRADKDSRTATASERPSVGPGRARDRGLRASLYGLPAGTSPTSDGPRHRTARQETRPNQRLYVPLGSPPSVAVGSTSTRAAHRSRAPISIIRG